MCWSTVLNAFSALSDTKLPGPVASLHPVENELAGWMHVGGEAKGCTALPATAPSDEYEHLCNLGLATRTSMSQSVRTISFNKY
jgi:hypothetical protein